MRKSSALAAMVAVPMLTAACGGDSHAASDATVEPNGEVAEVLSLDNNFIEQHLTVAAGTEVTWVNNGRNDHNILPEGDPAASQWGVTVDGFHPGDSYSVCSPNPVPTPISAASTGRPTPGCTAPSPSPSSDRPREDTPS